MAAAYAIYHGPDGLQDIAKRCLGLAKAASSALNKAGIDASEPSFDTIVVKCDSASVAEKAEAAGFNLRVFGPDEVGLSFGETVTRDDLVSILEDFRRDWRRRRPADRRNERQKNLTARRLQHAQERVADVEIFKTT